MNETLYECTILERKKNTKGVTYSYPKCIKLGLSIEIWFTLYGILRIYFFWLLFSL
jgi:hypothetical protein